MESFVSPQSEKETLISDARLGGVSPLRQEGEGRTGAPHPPSLNHLRNPCSNSVMSSVCLYLLNDVVVPDPPPMGQLVSPIPFPLTCSPTHSVFSHSPDCQSHRLSHRRWYNSSLYPIHLTSLLSTTLRLYDPCPSFSL